MCTWSVDPVYKRGTTISLTKSEASLLQDTQMLVTARSFRHYCTKEAPTVITGARVKLKNFIGHCVKQLIVAHYTYSFIAPTPPPTVSIDDAIMTASWRKLLSISQMEAR